MLRNEYRPSVNITYGEHILELGSVSVWIDSEINRECYYGYDKYNRRFYAATRNGETTYIAGEYTTPGIMFYCPEYNVYDQILDPKETNLCA